MHRALKIINISIAVAMVVALGVVYWYAWRPLPQHSGHISAEVASPVTVAFDKLGEPHIRAASVDDALFVQGYVTAQDRLWQMEALRRMAGGDLAEVVGPAALESDREARRLRLRRIAEQAYITLPPGDRAVFAAYARGVNAFIDSHRGSLPLEFTLLQYQPRPWSVVDSLLVSLHMYRTLSNSWRDKIVKYNMLAAGDARKVNTLFPVRAGWEPHPGSNAWVLAGSRTASHKPLLANDPHLEFSLPSIWYMLQLKAPGLDAAGVTIPGLPGIIIGHNRRIAWGVTSLEFDSQDLYLEKLDDRTGRYVFRGQVEQARREVDLIRVKGRPTVEIPTWVTRHGPIFAAEGNRRMALRWVAAEPGLIQYPMLDIDRAQNWQQFTAALARWPGPAQNFVYADVDGHIGYHAAGPLPVRRGFSGDVPVDGASGNYEWDGFIPFDQLPAVYDPPGGIIASSNQNPFPADYPYTVSGRFSAPYRVDQVRARLASRNNWRAEEMLAVQEDVYSGFGKFLAGQLVAAYDKRQMKNPGLDDAVALLRGWNGQMDRDSAAPFLIALAERHLRSTVVENAAPGTGATYDFPLATSAMETLLRERPAGWFDDYDDMLLRVLVDAVEEGQRIEGRDTRRWKYGAYLHWNMTNPVIHQLPWVGKYFDIGMVPMSGSGITVKQTTPRLGPSMRMDLDLGKWDASVLNILTGQSGQVLSSHYRDQWPAYYEGRSFPLQFENVKASGTVVFGK